MTLATALPVLHETASPERVGELPAARVADVRSLVARELAEIEELVRARLAKGVSPGKESARHLFDAGGKRVRPLGLLLATACFGVIDTRARDLGAAAELVHMATLLHDDVIDDGDQRRGHPTSRRIWGNAVSVLAGDMLLVEALRLASTSSDGADNPTWKELVATLGLLVDGEIVQLRGRVSVSLDEATYFDIVRGKTASLFEWALRAGARVGHASGAAIDALGRFGASIGVAFQLVDDLLDYEGNSTELGKNVGDDLREGKPTLPLLIAMERGTAAERDTIRHAIQHGELQKLEEILAIVRHTGALDATRAAAEEEAGKARQQLSALPESVSREALLELCVRSVHRSS